MEEKPPVAVPVNWEAVRALAMVVGVREAARRMGIKESAAQQRSAREGWLSSPEAKRANQMAIAQRSGLTAPACNQLSPGALISAELVALGQKSRLALARGIAKAGEHVESLSGEEILDRANDVKAVAQTADLVHGWKDAAPQVKIRLDVLNGNSEAPPIDIAAEVNPSWSEDCGADPLDDY